MGLWRTKSKQQRMTHIHPPLANTRGQICSIFTFLVRKTYQILHIKYWCCVHLLYWNVHLLSTLLTKCDFHHKKCQWAAQRRATKFSLLLDNNLLIRTKVESGKNESVSNVNISLHGQLEENCCVTFRKGQQWKES